MSYVPCAGWNANMLFLLSNVMAHNLTRELQMPHRERDRNTTVKRPALWKFSKIGTLYKQIIQRAGRLVRPQAILPLSMANNSAVEPSFLSCLPSQWAQCRAELLNLCNTGENYLNSMPILSATWSTVLIRLQKSLVVFQLIEDFAPTSETHIKRDRILSITN